MSHTQPPLRRAVRLLLVAVAAPVVWAGDFAIDWWSVDGGGGMSAGGQYALAGAMGQADAGTMSGGRFTVEGGFWPGVAPTRAERPTLLIQRAGETVTLSWPSGTAGYVLEASPNLAPSSWVEVSGGTTNPAILPVDNHVRFYRLRRP